MNAQEQEAVRTYTVDDLPRYSPWPARLLGLEPFQPKQKTPAEVSREFEGEKWGPLLRWAHQAKEPVRLDDVDAKVLGRAMNLCSEGQTLRPLGLREALRIYRDLIASTIAPFVPASMILELG